MGIAKLRHYVALCSMDDVVTDNGEMQLKRHDVLHSWAAIEPKKSSTFTREGYSIASNRDERTHKITMRYRSDINISVMAWLFEERLKSSPRWFKILSVSEKDEDARYFVFDCRLMDRADDTPRPVTNVHAETGFDL